MVAKNDRPPYRMMQLFVVDLCSLWPSYSSSTTVSVSHRHEHDHSLLRCVCRAPLPSPRVQSYFVACIGVLLDSSSQLQLLLFMGLNAAGFFVVACLKPFANR